MKSSSFAHESLWLHNALPSSTLKYLEISAEIMHLCFHFAKISTRNIGLTQMWADCNWGEYQYDACRWYSLLFCCRPYKTMVLCFCWVMHYDSKFSSTEGCCTLIARTITMLCMTSWQLQRTIHETRKSTTLLDSAITSKKIAVAYHPKLAGVLTVAVIQHWAY